MACRSISHTSQTSRSSGLRRDMCMAVSRSAQAEIPSDERVLMLLGDLGTNPCWRMDARRSTGDRWNRVEGTIYFTFIVRMIWVRWRFSFGATRLSTANLMPRPGGNSIFPMWSPEMTPDACSASGTQFQRQFA